MTGSEDERDAAEAFRADVAKGSKAIGNTMEVMQANLFITRALVDLLQEHQSLRLSEVRDRAQALATAAGLTPGAVAALRQLLDEDGPAASVILQ